MNINPPPGWQERNPSVSFDEQLELFSRHFLEFYRYDRGNQTYLDFLRQDHPEVILRFTEDFIQGMKQTQRQFLRIEKKECKIDDMFSLN